MLDNTETRIARSRVRRVNRLSKPGYPTWKPRVRREPDEKQVRL